MNDSSVIDAARQVESAFARQLNGVSLDHEIKERPDGVFLFFYVAYPSGRMFSALQDALEKVGQGNMFFERTAVQRRSSKPRDVVSTPEARMLQKELSESLTVDRHTFGDEFAARYTTSVTNFEQNIVGRANYVVYGRRGSGKSSLLAYAMHQLRETGSPFCWIALQAYAGRSDSHATARILSDIVEELAGFGNQHELFALSAAFAELGDSSKADVTAEIQKMLPRARKAIGAVASSKLPVTIFLDDLHVLDEGLQPRLLSAIYSMTRGNNCYIKASGIEQFTNIWSADARQGLEPPHDAQILKLDHNLTMPDLSRDHIKSILDAHAQYCGMPGIAYLADEEVVDRLVLVAAAVPRDALSLFSQAITKSGVKRQRAVTITSINAAASEAVEEKLRDVGRDLAEGDVEDVRRMLDELRRFCIKQRNVNAFLVRIDATDDWYKTIQKLIALRFVHVLHEGITPHRVGDRFIALMLDYGFYIGIRAAKSVKLFPDKPKSLPAKELRKLPVFSASGVVTARRS